MRIIKKGFIVILTLMLIFSSISVFAAAGNTWTTKAPALNFVRETAVINGKIYTVGGNYSGDRPNKVAEYDPETNKWTVKAVMNTAYDHKVAVANGKIYAIGGYLANNFIKTVEEYDPIKNVSTTKASMNTGRCYHELAVVNSKIYVIGGTDGNKVINTVQEYNPQTNTWTTKAPMSIARRDFCSAVVNGKIYAIGGYDPTNSTILNTVEEYDPQINKWITKVPTITARCYYQVAVVNEKIYAIGGYNPSTNTALNTVEEYDPIKNTWTTKAPMSTARNGHQVAVVDGKIYAIGGYNPSTSTAFNTVEEYDPIKNTWTTKAPTSTARNGHQVAVVNGKINVIGGDSTNSVEEYTPGVAPEAVKITAETGKTSVGLSWDSVSDAASYNIKRSTTAGGSYTTIATSSAITYTDTTVTNETTYYYIVTAVNEGGESENSNEVSVTPTNPAVTLEVTSVDKAKVRDEITANVVIHNATNICAEDIKVAFDTSRLEFIGAENADGIKIYKEDGLTEGIRRYITASLGKTNAANGDKILLKLKFKAKAVGEAKIDITNGRIADNATLEKDIEEKNCGKKIVLIEEKSKDVNRSGEFTLLDLGIDAWYYGDAAANTDTSKYDADVVANGTIDDNDLAEIVKQILSNSNYPAVSK